ncbi:MAG: hypothetical protein K6T83_01370 [Alicyclobacillus sp.]|nr:hypothetical protein [Alicyclobacillus sp.]
MESMMPQIEQRLVTGIARMMLDISQRYNLSHVEYPKKRYSEGTDGAAGESLAAMVLLELKQCRRSSLERIEKPIGKWRDVYSRFFHSSEFRRAAKLYGYTWAIEEEQRQGRDYGYQWLVHTMNYLLNEVMSPIGLSDDLSGIWIHGRNLSLGAINDVDDLTDIHRRLPQFVGLFDYMDTDTLATLCDRLPSRLVSPTWYKNQEFNGDSVEDAFSLYRAITERYQTLQQTHVIDDLGGPVKTVTVMELDRGPSHRCLMAIPSFEGINGSDVYIATFCRRFSGSGMLVGNPDGDPGAEVVYAVYKALGQAIEEETGDGVDIDALIEKLDEEWMDFEEL